MDGWENIPLFSAMRMISELSSYFCLLKLHKIYHIVLLQYRTLYVCRISTHIHVHNHTYTQSLKVFSFQLSTSAAAAAKSPDSCPTLCDPMDCSPPGSSIHGSFQARVLEWGATAFSEAPLVLAIMTQQFPSHLLSFWPTQVIKLWTQDTVRPHNLERTFPPFYWVLCFCSNTLAYISILKASDTVDTYHACSQLRSIDLQSKLRTWKTSLFNLILWVWPILSSGKIFLDDDSFSNGFPS